jgi:hypothetical protein
MTSQPEVSVRHNLADNAALAAVRHDIESELAGRLDTPLSERDALAVRVAVVKALVAGGRIAVGTLGEHLEMHGVRLAIHKDNGDDFDEWAKRYGDDSGGREPHWWERGQIGDGKLDRRDLPLLP